MSAALASLASFGVAHAAGMSISPVLLDLQAPATTASVTLRTSGQDPIAVQVRVFRWTQQNGEDRVDPTRDVVASPPLVRLQPGADYQVRIVRLAKQPATSEESYRLLVDELPDPGRRRAGTVSLLVRYSVPVFFGPDTGAADVKWTATRAGGGIAVTAINTGTKRARIVDLSVEDGGGHVVAERRGLAGYVLAGATRHWTLRGKAGGGSLHVRTGRSGGKDASASGAP
ncbi:fimbrial biogenesis chaperone [Faunimonas pinastri]|uniref:fimbrial biogenesis chaperone n=1 Tax=Faunimonas pinastri TaxID=1855383 RepID=UPI0015A50354|nr:molecular chaperone [Faunimonas pinastri]